MSTDDLTLTQYIDPEQLKADVQIDMTNLTDGMARHTSLYTHYAIQSTRAQRQYDRWKLTVDVVESQLDAHHRNAMTEEGKKVTENAVKAAIANDPRMRTATTRMHEAKQMKDLCDAALMCFVHRKDMLLQLARDAAAERAGELRVSARAESTEASRERVLSLLQKPLAGGVAPASAEG